MEANINDIPATPALPAPKKFYFGKPENQRDPNARLAAPRKKPQAKPTFGKKPGPPPDLPKKIPPPSHLHQAPANAISTTSAELSSAIFTRNMRVREVAPEIEFLPSCNGVLEISRDMYDEMTTDDPTLRQSLLPEYVDYYATALLWFKILKLKLDNSVPLTEAERTIWKLVCDITLVSPEPLTLMLKHLGKVTSKLGIHLEPSFPPLPEHVINNHGGYWPALGIAADTVGNHNLYEEIPCFGVLSSAVRAAISNDLPGAYASDVLWNNQQPNSNLLGFKALGVRSTEAKLLASDLGITDAVFPEDPFVQKPRRKTSRKTQLPSELVL